MKKSVILLAVCAAAFAVACTDKPDPHASGKADAEQFISVEPAMATIKEGESLILVTDGVAPTRWFSSNTAVATVDAGVVTGTGVGTASIYALAGGSLGAKCTVTVLENGIHVEYITLSPASLPLAPGESATLTVSFYPEDNTDNLSVSWSSSDESVATVENGLVTALANGSAVITATAGEFTADANVIVSDGSAPPVSDTKIVRLSSNYFRVDWPATYEVLDNVTMEGWVYGDSFLTSGNDNLHVFIGVEGVFQIRFDGNVPELIYGTTEKTNGEYNEGKVRPTGTTLSDQQWYHLAAVYSRAGEVALYVDGTKVATGTAQDHGIKMNGVGSGWAGGGLAEWVFYIGVGCQTSRDFDGSLADVRVWKRALTATEVAANKTNAAITDSDIIGFWRFGEGSGNTITDYSNSGLNLTANSDLSWIDGTRPF